MTTRDLNENPITNLEVFLNTRYNTAHDLLATDVDAAERIFISLLQQSRLPLWKRAQCNLLLASIGSELTDAPAYLNDARHAFALYKEGRVAQPDTAKMTDMEERFDEVEKDIAERVQVSHEQGSGQSGQAGDEEIGHKH